MKKWLSILIVFFVLSCQSRQTTVIVKITDTFSGNSKEVKVTGKNKLTALEALQYAATVETHPVGNYVFVTSIDSLKAEKFNTAWYYKIKGKSPGVLAINRMVKEGDTIEWIFTRDNCSANACKK